MPILDLYAPAVVRRDNLNIAVLAARVWPTHRTQSDAWRAGIELTRKSNTRVEARD